MKLAFAVVAVVVAVACEPAPAPAPAPEAPMYGLDKIGSIFTPVPAPSSALEGEPFDSVLIRADAPDEHGTTWAINLASWRVSGNASRNLTAVDVKARVQIGADGATDEFLVDYPTSGTTFCVQGQSLTVSVSGRTKFNAQPPILGAWATINPAGTNRAESTTFSAPTIVIPADSTEGVNIPPRARSFRLYILGFGAQTFTLSQLDGQSRDVASMFGVNRGVVQPIHPEAQRLLINNDDAANILQVSVQFLLETCG